MKITFLACLAALCAFAVTPVQAADSYADLVAKVQDAVVNVQTSQRARSSRDRSDLFDFFRAPRSNEAPRPRGAGSGFVISNDGYIVTNRHVVEEASEITVFLTNNRSYSAKLIGADDSMDVALIKIEAENLPYLRIGDSEAVRIGDTLLAMGFPLQLGFTVTRGILSGIGRNLGAGGVDLATYLQTDADITFGNSGGPLINVKGEVIGLNTMIVSSGETYGLAIPSNLFMHSVDQLKQYGKVRRGAIGVALESLTPEALEYYGVDYGALVSRVSKGMPADRAGIKNEDVILEINGRRVRDSGDVVATLSSLPPGQEVAMLVLSEGRKKEKTIKLADRNDLYGDNAAEPERPEEPEAKRYGLGLSVTPLDSDTRRELELDRNVEGLFVTEVDPDSVAAQRGVRPGAVITHINNQPVRDGGDVREALEDIDDNAPVKLRLIQVARTRDGLVPNERTVFLRKSRR